MNNSSNRNSKIDTKTVRINKFFTDCGILSRRAAEAEIEAGRVKVNGEIAILGQKIDPKKDTVEYKGRRIMPRRGEDKKFTYVMLNKPCGYITTMTDDRGRKCVSELVADVGKRIYPVGRLDMYSDGLLLFTDDGELTNLLTHPKHEIPKIYHVKVKGSSDEKKIKELGKPMEIDGYKIEPVKVEIASDRSDSCILRMTLYEGRNRQIRKMCEQVHLEILSLRRVAIGDITLGDLPQGKWRHLSGAEVRYLKDSLLKAKAKRERQSKNA
jgi:23S rRNA pseudouridine2605 synthase